MHNNTKELYNMDKSKYNQMIHAQEQHANAWRFIFDAWNCNEWKSLPQQIKHTLGLHESIGVCSGVLVTRAGAKGLNEFIVRMNRSRTS